MGITEVKQRLERRKFLLEELKNLHQRLKDVQGELRQIELCPVKKEELRTGTTLYLITSNKSKGVFYGDRCKVVQVRRKYVWVKFDNGAELLFEPWCLSKG